LYQTGIIAFVIVIVRACYPISIESYLKLTNSLDSLSSKVRDLELELYLTALHILAKEVTNKYTIMSGYFVSRLCY
jgi:hypothetical protein